MQIEINEDFRKALDILENTKKHVFITGKAGTGKSTLLSYFRAHTKKKIVVLAPTGVAALNVHGQTIHSFFRFKPDITLEKVRKLNPENKNNLVYKKLEALVIDEISMVRADLLDCVDKFLRLNGPVPHAPFGGVQLIFFGDLYQLPPVVTGPERELFRSFYKSPYFFDAQSFSQIEIELLELVKIYRQKDPDFIEVLNAVRNNTVNDLHLTKINTRLFPDYQPAENEFTIHLTTINEDARKVNDAKLEKLPGKMKKYYANISGDFDPHSMPTKAELFLKVGAQIMLLNNDQYDRWVNGSIGKIIKIEKDEEEDVILVEMTSGEIVEVTPFTWELFNFTYDEGSKQIKSETVGSFTQYPLMLSWAITIHKSQGKTFNKVIIDLGRGSFAHGQTYVALSRCTSLSGIFLKKPVSKKHILMDWRVVKFLTSFQYDLSEKNVPVGDKVNLLKKSISEKSSLEIVYLKSSDEKSQRIIKPKKVGEMEYLGKTFLGVSAFDSKRGEERTFRVEKILSIREVNN